MVDGHGGLRPHWRSLMGAFTGLGEGGLRERARRLDDAFQEEGITSVLPGTSAAEHAFRCDPIPLLLPADEFAALESGLAQRARLLAAILADIYGPRSLLESGALPPALVHPNPGFLRFARNGEAPILQFYAADLVRGPDGTWRVLADRTAGPSGIGYARENRRLLGRVLPEAFRAVQVRQLRPFFDIWQDALRRLAPPGRPNPTVALLTPGTTHPQWFEHMFLSRELSCALVEGGDLTTRDGKVFLKTLKGLQQVDVLLRRVYGRLVDPLELEPSRGAGVSGLLDAMRAGSIRVANDPGSGVLEAPALSAFLPGIAMRLLGERLEMESVPTMWLGEAPARSLVERDFDDWLIRPALDGRSSSVAPAALSDRGRAALLARIGARPWEWAASAIVPPSVAPCVAAGGMEPAPVLLRLFLAHDGRDWRAMQGGLARVLDGEGHYPGQLPTTGISKDVWVLAEERSNIVGPAVHATVPLAIRRTSADLPSRVADDLFWLGRYVERLERAARLLRAAISRIARGAVVLPREVADLRALARCLTEAGFIPAEAAGLSTPGTMAAALLATVRDGGKIDVLFDEVARLTEKVRDRLTGDMYATFTQTLRPARAGVEDATSLDGLAHAMVGIQRFTAAVAGVAAENMVRGGGWLFLDLGRRLERSRAILGEITSALDQSPARIEGGLLLILELCDSAITYRARYLNVVQAAPVLDLVLVDQGNPRGLAFQLTAMHSALDELSSGGATRELLAGAAAGLLAEVEILVESVLSAPDQATAAAGLPPRLEEVGQGLAALSDRITRRYFALLPAVQTLGWAGDAGKLRGAA